MKFGMGCPAAKSSLPAAHQSVVVVDCKDLEQVEGWSSCPQRDSQRHRVRSQTFCRRRCWLVANDNIEEKERSEN